MTRKHLRSRKELVKSIEHGREKDTEAIGIIKGLGTSMLKVCEEKDVEPESMLSELILLTMIANGVLMKKYRTQFPNPDGKPWTKRQERRIHDDIDRLWSLLREDCANTLGDIDEAMRGVEDKKDQIEIERRSDDRPIYIN